MSTIKEVSDVIYDVVTNGIRLTLDFLQSEDKDTRTASKRSSKSRPGKSRPIPTTLFRADYLTQLMQKSA